MSNEIEIYRKIENPIDAIDRMGDWLSKSGMFGCTKVEQGKVLAMACLAEKKSPLEVVRNYHIIDGRLSQRSDSMLANFHAAGGKSRIICRTADKAEVELTKDGQPTKFSLTFEEVKQEPFVWTSKNELKRNWATPRARMQMLWARVVSDGVRAISPEIVVGVYTPEEISDTTGEVDVKPLLATEPAKPQSAVIDVQTVQPSLNQAHKDFNLSKKEDEKELAAMGLAPVQQEEKQVTALPDGGLSQDDIEMLKLAVPENLRDAALQWLKIKGHTTGDWADVKPAMAANIVKWPARFADKVKADMKVQP